MSPGYGEWIVKTIRTRVAAVPLVGERSRAK